MASTLACLNFLIRHLSTLWSKKWNNIVRMRVTFLHNFAPKIKQWFYLCLQQKSDTRFMGIALFIRYKHNSLSESSKFRCFNGAERLILLRASNRIYREHCPTEWR